MRNRGELAEGWYDPAALRKAQAASSASLQPTRQVSHDNPLLDHRDKTRKSGEDPSDSSEDEVLGPDLPSELMYTSMTRDPNAPRSGPSIPTLEDMELQKGVFASPSTKVSLMELLLTKITEQDLAEAHASSLSLHHARKEHNKTQKALMEDLAPRQDPGTRARALEKRADTRAANNTFAAAKLDAGADVPELAEADMFGGGDDGLAGFKRRKAEQERVRTERELRREAIQRARREEREQRGREYRRKEEAVMRGLVEMARKRFG